MFPHSGLLLALSVEAARPVSVWSVTPRVLLCLGTVPPEILKQMQPLGPQFLYSHSIKFLRLLYPFPLSVASHFTSSLPRPGIMLASLWPLALFFFLRSHVAQACYVALRDLELLLFLSLPSSFWDYIIKPGFVWCWRSKPDLQAC